MPEMRDNHLYNVGYLCRRDGSREKYEKLHVTPDEARVWGMQGGDVVKTFDTDCGKIGVLICYDVEFPELRACLPMKGCKFFSSPSLPTRKTATRR